MTEAEVKAARKRLGKQVVDAKATESNGTEDGNQRPRKEKPVGKRVNYHVNKPVPEDFYVPKKKESFKDGRYIKQDALFPSTNVTKRSS